MALMVHVLVVVVIIWTLLMIKDYMMRHKKTSKLSSRWKAEHSVWCQNFILRFIYLFFFELWICALLQLTVDDFDKEVTMTQYVFAIIAIIILSGLVAFLLSLYFWNGPWASGFFTKWTSTRSLVSVRPRNPSFDLGKFKQENPKKKMRSPILRYAINTFSQLFGCAPMSKEIVVKKIVVRIDSQTDYNP